MTVRNVIGGALALVMLIVLALVGWQLTNLTTDMTNVKAAMLTRHDLVEASKSWAASKESDSSRVGDVGRGAIVPANYVTPASDSAKEPPLAPQSASGPAAKSSEPSGNESLKSLSDELQKVKQELAEVQAKVVDNIEATRIVRNDLKYIVKKDNAGAPIVAMRELSQNSEFRNEFSKAVNEVVQPRLPPPGTVRIVNRMGTSQYLEVNGVGRWIGPLSSLDVVVPAGDATTRLPGYEPTKLWRLDAGNNYFQSVIIDPQPIYTPIIYY